MQSTIILKSDAVNALMAAHRLMQEMSDRTPPCTESLQYQRGFSAAISTIATVFGLDLDIHAHPLSSANEWHLADETCHSLATNQPDALEWSGNETTIASFASTGRG